MYKKSVVRSLFIWLMAFAVLLVSGCHSSRRVTSQGDPVTNRDYTATESPDAMGRELVDAALKWLGTRYRYGGDSHNGTDCSGLVMRLYSDVCDIKLPRTTLGQRDYCTGLKRKEARPGDLVFFGSSKSNSSVSHVGIYIGKGEMVHASSSRGVVVSDIDNGYWADRFKGVGRVDGAQNSWAMARRKKGGKDNGSLLPGLPRGEGNTVRNAEVSVDLLDVIINAKVDSIFSNQFMD